jgi:ketosteroid isomerase-like protein
MHSSEAEVSTLKQTSKDWASATSAGDVDLIVSYWDDDAVVLPPGQQPVVGKKAIREYVLQSMALPGFSITWEPEHATIAAGGEFGYLLEKNVVTLKDLSGTLRTQVGKTVTIWRKNTAGEWKCVVDIWNDNPG